MSLDESILSYVVKNPQGFVDIQRAGVTEEFFVEDYGRAWAWIAKMKRKHGKVPSKSVVLTRFPDLDFVKVRDRDVPIIVHDLKNRKKYLDFLSAIDEAAQAADTPDDIDVAMSMLQGSLSRLALSNGDNAIVDLFAEDAMRRMRKDIRQRKKRAVQGIPTGLKRFDAITGGLQKGRLVTVIARPGKGKSWLNLLFVASAVTYGAKVILYPLEMSLEDTALRLYTIFSCKMFGPTKALKNTDLTNGRVSKAKVVKLLNLLQDRYAGQLLVADIGSLSDPYTMDRVEAEGEMYRPDMQWIDYITLMKAPGVGRNGGEDFTTIKALSNGGKQVATRGKRIVGMSAQVNRESIRGSKLVIPRLENIAYGDSIGQDSDQVIGLARPDSSPDLYYALIKNRHGPETGKIRVRFAVNSGNIEEHEDQEEDGDDD